MRYFLSIVLIIANLSGFSQSLEDDKPKSFIDNERTFNILFSSNGFGGGFQYGKRKDGFTKIIYAVELSVIRNEKEKKINNPYFPNERRFVFGKKNLYVNLRLEYGLQKKKFSKIGRGGIEIRYFGAVGPTVAFLKPIYYEIIYSDSLNPYILRTKSEKFDPTSIHSFFDIHSRSSFFKGLNEIKIIPGIFAKIGTGFEYSLRQTKINAIEAGMAVDIFPKRVPVMAIDKNPFVFFSLFINYRFGRIIDPLERIKRKSGVSGMSKKGLLEPIGGE